MKEGRMKEGLMSERSERIMSMAAWIAPPTKEGS